MKNSYSRWCVDYIANYISIWLYVKFLALTGSRKQSVQDAERFFSLALADHMGKKGYNFEEKLIRTVANWRRAGDERGLTELQRCKFNYQLLNLLLDDLMPWHCKPGLYDFSLLEVTRWVYVYIRTYVARL